VLTRTAPGSDRGAGALVRVPLDSRDTVDASQLRAVSIPFASTTVPFEAGSLARNPRTGDLYVTEARGRHLYRVTPEGAVTVFAGGGNALGDGRALVFDAPGSSPGPRSRGTRRGRRHHGRPASRSGGGRRALPGPGGPLAPGRREAPAPPEPR